MQHQAITRRNQWRMQSEAGQKVHDGDEQHGMPGVIK
jgi:hypothetical protein